MSAGWEWMMRELARENHTLAAISDRFAIGWSAPDPRHLTVYIPQLYAYEDEP